VTVDTGEPGGTRWRVRALGFWLVVTVQAEVRTPQTTRVHPVVVARLAVSVGERLVFELPNQ
jgi:hypothetical protein